MDTKKVGDHLFRTQTRQAVYKSLDASMLRSKAVAQNVANVDVPGYQRKEVAFEEALRKALKIKSEGARTQPEHIEIGKKAALKKVHPESYEPYDPSNASGKNNVDIDIEAAKLAENQILYNFSIKFAGFSKLKSAINGRMQ